MSRSAYGLIHQKLVDYRSFSGLGSPPTINLMFTHIHIHTLVLYRFLKPFPSKSGAHPTRANTVHITESLFLLNFSQPHNQRLGVLWRKRYIFAIACIHLLTESPRNLQTLSSTQCVSFVSWTVILIGPFADRRRPCQSFPQLGISGQ